MTTSPPGSVRSTAPPSLTWAAGLARCFGWLAVDLGIRDEGAEVEGEVHALLEEPVALYEAHPNWPSSMSAVGPPVELSVRLDWGRSPALRLVVDVTDHRVDLAGNWRRYLAAAQSVLGSAADESDTRRLCQSHLSGIPPESRSRMLHGIGYGAGGARRSTLYFRSWLDHDPVTERLLTRAGFPDQDVELVGYDVAEGAQGRVKLYCPLTLPQTAELLAGASASDPQLGAARTLFDVFGDVARSSTPRSDVHFLQLSLDDQVPLDGGTAPRKLFFPCATWGWSAPAGFQRLLVYLGSVLGVALDPLGCFLDRLIGDQITVLPTFVAVSGPDTAASVTFYVSPIVSMAPVVAPMTGGVPSHATGRGRGGEKAGLAGVAGAALAYLAEHQDPDGVWRDYDVRTGTDANGGRCLVEGQSTAFTTAYVSGCLVGIPAAGMLVRRAAGALLDRWCPDQGWGWNEAAAADAETTALALAVVSATGLAAPAGWRAALVAHQGDEGGFRAEGANAAQEESLAAADVTAAVLLALQRLNAGDPSVATAKAHLRDHQSGDGRWRSVWWSSDLVATARGVEALTAASARSGDDETALARAVDALMAWPLRDDPFEMGWWLTAWRAVDGRRGWTSVRRSLSALSAQQWPDGHWSGGPHRRIRRRSAHGGAPLLTFDAATAVIDGRSLVTTASALRGISVTVDGPP